LRASIQIIYSIFTLLQKRSRPGCSCIRGGI